jgi:RHS repeat-associated protein
VYGLNVDQVLAQDSSTGMVWALADRLGSVETLTDGEGVVVDQRTFDSFGRVLSETNPSVQFRYGYTGRELDLESGLNYYRARYYDPENGRFISVDLMGFGAGDTNLYRYVGNNSTNATDPTGELAWFAIPLIVAVGGALLGAYQNYDYQQSRIADGKQHNVDYTDVAISAAWGAVGATAGLAITTLAPESIPFFAATGLVSGTSSYLQAKDAESRGEYNTASHYYKMGIFDVAGSIFASAHPPSIPPSLQSAMALASSTSVGGALVGSRVSDIFQHYFASSNQSGESGHSGGDSGRNLNQELGTFLDNNVNKDDIPALQSIMENDKSIKSLGDAQLILDARKIHQTWPEGKAQGTKTVATGVLFDSKSNIFRKVYTVSNNKTSESARLKATDLGYERIYGKQYTQKPGQTDAEQILINYAEKNELIRTDVEAPIAPSRPACGVARQDCSGRIDRTDGVRLIGSHK